MIDDLEYYIVGGYVRDTLMDNEPNDKDYVVVGSNPEEMESLGFEQVGKGFPVFIHSETGDEWALARTEDKTDDGYYGFDCEWKGVELEQDLKRRDFTINAMAMDDNGTIIDPFDGQEDIDNGVLRHVSSAFKEDPLRILRMARFATRLGFEIADGTLELAKEVVGELPSLPNERYGQEIKKACKESKDIVRYFKVLDSAGALDVVMPKLAQLEDVPAGYNDNHQEGDALIHTMLVLNYIQMKRPQDVEAYLMALSHDLGKYVTHHEDKGNHGGHDKKGIDLAKELSDHLRLSNDLKNSMKESCRSHLRLLNLPKMRAGKTIKFIDRLTKSNVEIEKLLDVCEADKWGRIPTSEIDRDKIEDHITKAQQAIEEWTGQRLKESGYEGTGEAFGQTLLNRRAHRYKELINA